MSQKFIPVDLSAIQHSCSAQQPVQEENCLTGLSAASRDKLLAIGGVVGYGLSTVDEIVIYVNADEVSSQLPQQIEGRKVRAELTGVIRASTNLI